jgi:hypothetical protein
VQGLKMEAVAELCPKFLTKRLMKAENQLETGRPEWANFRPFGDGLL